MTDVIRPSKTVHGAHPTVENYTMCAITHEGDQPARLAGPGERINCPNCRVVINAATQMLGLRPPAQTLQPASNAKVDALIRRVNQRIPNSVTPATRIEIHPSEWLTLVEAANAPETPVLPKLEFAEYCACCTRNKITVEVFGGAAQETRVRLRECGDAVECDMRITIASDTDEKVSDCFRAIDDVLTAVTERHDVVLTIECITGSAVSGSEKAAASLPPCECLVRNKEPSAYHNVKCPRYVAGLL